MFPWKYFRLCKIMSHVDSIIQLEWCGQQQQTTTPGAAPICWEQDTRRYKLTLARQHWKEKNIIWSLGKFSQHKPTEHCLITAVDASVAADLVHRFMSTPETISRSHVTELQSCQTGFFNATMSLLWTDGLHDNLGLRWWNAFRRRQKRDNNCWMEPNLWGMFYSKGSKCVRCD